jgi:thiamine kinase-like enzyme
MIELRENRFGIYNTPEEILAILTEIARIYDLSSRRSGTYYLWDHTTIRRINWFSPSSIKRFLGAWRRGGIPERLPSTCGAETLRVKNHYLGFYPTKGVLIKVFLDPDAYQSHIEAVERFNSFGFQHISAPHIHHKAIDPITHTVEEFVPGRNFLELPLDLSNDLLDELARFHFDRPAIAKLELNESEKTQISKILEGFDLEPDQSSALLGLLEKDSWQVVLGEVHGDLSPGNLIQGRDGIFLTDWEGYSRGPVAQDLVKLYFQANEKLREVILHSYKKALKSLPISVDAGLFQTNLLFYTLRLLISITSKEHITMTQSVSSRVEKTRIELEKKIRSSLQSQLIRISNLD